MSLEKQLSHRDTRIYCAGKLWFLGGWKPSKLGVFLARTRPKQQAKKMRLLGRIREGYSALNSEEESCISRVAAILAITVK